MLPLNSPEAIKYIAEIAKIVYANAVYIPVFLTTRAIMYDEYAWTNWPTGEKMYWGLSYWNPVYILPVTVYIQPTGRAPSSEVTLPAPTYTYVTLYAKANIPEFIGIDGKMYGPYTEGDLMTIPKEDADRLIAENKATLKPLVAPEIKEMLTMISDIISRVSSLENSINNIGRDVSTKIDAITTTITSMEIAIIVLVIIV